MNRAFLAILVYMFGLLKERLGENIHKRKARKALFLSYIANVKVNPGESL